MGADSKGIISAYLLVVLFFAIFNTGFSHQLIVNIGQVNIDEPCGVAFHPGGNTLFVVGDEGDVCEIQTDGSR